MAFSPVLDGTIVVAACVALLVASAWLGARIRRGGSNRALREWEEVYLPVSAALFVSAWVARREFGVPSLVGSGSDHAQTVWLASGLPAAVCLALAGIGLVSGEGSDRRAIVAWACAAALLGSFALAGDIGLLDGQLLVLGVVVWCWWRLGGRDSPTSGAAGNAIARGAGVPGSVLGALSVAAGVICGGVAGPQWAQDAATGVAAGSIGGMVLAGGWGRVGVVSSIAAVLSVAAGVGSAQVARVVSAAMAGARDAVGSGSGPWWFGVLNSLVPPRGMSGFGMLSVEAVCVAGAVGVLAAGVTGLISPRSQRVVGGALVVAGLWLVLRGAM